MSGMRSPRTPRPAILVISLLFPLLRSACGGNTSPAVASGTSAQETYAAVSAAFAKAQADSAEPVLETSNSLGPNSLGAIANRANAQIAANPASGSYFVSLR